MATQAPIPITQLGELRAQGISYPATVDGWRWAYRQRAARGLEDAFVRIGRRVCVLPDRYIAATRGEVD